MRNARQRPSSTFPSRGEIYTFDLRGSLYWTPFKHQFDEMRAYFLAIADDDILYGFRRRAGQQRPDEGLGGWHNNDVDVSFMPDSDEIFNTFGQWLSVLARIYAVT